MICEKCSSLHDGSYASGRFCSAKCSRSFSSLVKRESTNIKVSRSLKGRVFAHGFQPGSTRPLNSGRKRGTVKKRKCTACGGEFANPNQTRKSCSEQCSKYLSREAGKKSASNRIKRSKDEIELFNLCTDKFVSVGNNAVLAGGWDADIVVHDYRMAILWNGPWHYRQMPGLKHSLAQVKNRDNLKTNTLSAAGWMVLAFNDNHYSPQSAFEEICSQAQKIDARINSRGSGVVPRRFHMPQTPFESGCATKSYPPSGILTRVLMTEWRRAKAGVQHSIAGDWPRQDDGA